MSTMMAVPLAVAAGLILVVLGLLLQVRERSGAMNELLDFARADGLDAEPTATGAPVDVGTLTRGAVSLAARLVAQVDNQGALAASLERARIPMRPGEYAIVGACAAAVSGLFVGVVTANAILGAVGAVFVVAVVTKVPAVRISRRRKRLSRQLPDALSLIASSLSAGHTFLRAIQMMCEECDPPLSDEFGRVVFEVRLGAPLVEALDRMAQRSGVADLAWVVQAIRIQQTVGGKLADLLHTLADFIRAREEVRREVDVLTAEGRVSAWILGAMPILLLVAVQVISPGYADPLFHGWGLAALAFTAASICTGVYLILRMVRIEV